MKKTEIFETYKTGVYFMAAGTELRKVEIAHIQIEPNKATYYDANENILFIESSDKKFDSVYMTEEDFKNGSSAPSDFIRCVNSSYSVKVNGKYYQSMKRMTQDGQEEIGINVYRMSDTDVEQVFLPFVRIILNKDTADEYFVTPVDFNFYETREECIGYNAVHVVENGVDTGRVVGGYLAAIQLTDAQKKVLRKFEKILKEMDDCNLELIGDTADCELLVCNKEKFSFGWTEGNGIANGSLAREALTVVRNSQFVYFSSDDSGCYGLEEK